MKIDLGIYGHYIEVLLLGRRQNFSGMAWNDTSRRTSYSEPATVLAYSCHDTSWVNRGGTSDLVTLFTLL